METGANRQCDVLVIGGGPGGTPTATALATHGKRVLLVEQGPGLGGTCLFEGCIPSKILRESARRLRDIRKAADFGLCLASADTRIDWYAIQQRKRVILRQRADAARERLGRLPGMELISGRASLSDSHHARIGSADGKVLRVRFEQAVIATGSEPRLPPIRGVDLPHVYDSDRFLDIDHIPEQLTVIGGGPVGVELAQIMHALGSGVTLLQRSERILGPVDEELALALQERMRADGIALHTGADITHITHTGQGAFVFFTDAEGRKRHVLSTEVLLVTGRRPRVEGLGLENTAVEHDGHGIRVDSELRTAEPNIFAVGDVTGAPMFAHWATAQGLALARHLLGQPAPFPSPAANPAVIFSFPELGMVGLSEQAARAQGIDYGVARYDFRVDARSQIQGSAEGQLKILYQRTDQRIIGVHVLAAEAAPLMGEGALLVALGTRLEDLAGGVAPHPTLSESFVLAARAALAK